LTDQWVHQRLSNQHYEAWYRQLADAVAAADANFAAQQQQNQTRHGRGSERLSEGGSGKQPVSTPRLVAEKDYRCDGAAVTVRGQAVQNRHRVHIREEQKPLGLLLLDGPRVEFGMINFMPTCFHSNNMGLSNCRCRLRPRL
jgi:hypothetical protein